MEEVTGNTASGVVGVLLALNAPVITVRFPLGTTLKGKSNVMGAGTASVLTTYVRRVSERWRWLSGVGREVALLALIKTALTLVSRVTLQYSVPWKVGSVLGRYSVPRWVLKSYCTAR